MRGAPRLSGGRIGYDAPIFAVLRRRSPGWKVCGGSRQVEESETPFLDRRYSEKRQCFYSLAGLFSVTAIARLVCLLFCFLPFQ